MALASHYKVLGLQPGCSFEDVQIAFRKLALRLHPDKNPNDKDGDNEELCKRVIEAFQTIRDANATEKHTSQTDPDGDDMLDHLRFSDVEEVLAEAKRALDEYIMKRQKAPAWTRSRETLFSPVRATWRPGGSSVSPRPASPGRQSECILNGASLSHCAQAQPPTAKQQPVPLNMEHNGMTSPQQPPRADFLVCETQSPRVQSKDEALESHRPGPTHVPSNHDATDHFSAEASNNAVRRFSQQTSGPRPQPSRELQHATQSHSQPASPSSIISPSPSWAFRRVNSEALKHCMEPKPQQTFPGQQPRGNSRDQKSTPCVKPTNAVATISATREGTAGIQPHLLPTQAVPHEPHRIEESHRQATVLQAHRVRGNSRDLAATQLTNEARRSQVGKSHSATTWHVSPCWVQSPMGSAQQSWASHAQMVQVAPRTPQRQPGQRCSSLSFGVPNTPPRTHTAKSRWLAACTAQAMRSQAQGAEPLNCHSVRTRVAHFESMSFGPPARPSSAPAAARILHAVAA